MKTIVRSVAALGLVLATGQVLAQQVFVYPQKGQSQKQQDIDSAECGRWAKTRLRRLHVDSERVVRSPHSYQSNPETIDEVRRILRLQAAQVTCGSQSPSAASASGGAAHP